MKKALLIIVSLLTAYLGHTQVISDPREAFKLSAQNGQDILMVFSGSDWCIPCIQFEKKILSDTAFQNFAADKLIVLKADFPQKKKIPADLKSQYESLAERYNPNGNFPYIVLVAPDKRMLANISYQNQSAIAFVAELKGVIR
ncbi:MAG: thioredoxin family protein [Flavipsychrobacter sp.]